MRNYQRCKPCCGCCNQERKSQECNSCECDEKVIVEPTVHCCSQKHHHKRIRHIVPIVYHQTHHHHKHHEYEVKRKYTQEHCHYEHGRFDGDWCEKDAGVTNEKGSTNSQFEKDGEFN